MKRQSNPPPAYPKPPPPPAPPPKRVLREDIFIKEADRTTLKPSEPHPAARSALNYIRKIPLTDLLLYQGAFATNAIEGNRLAEVCLGTLNRLLHFEPVSDRYLLGLAWTLMEMRRDVPTQN